MAATAPDGSGRRSASIANLLLPSTDLPEKNLLSLSHLAATMEPASPASPPRFDPERAARRRAAAAQAFAARTRSVPIAVGKRPTPVASGAPSAAQLQHQQLQHHTPTDGRKRLSKAAGGAANGGASLGVSHPSQKKIGRTKSGFAANSSFRRAAMRVAAAPQVSSDADSNNSAPRTPPPPPPGAMVPGTPSMPTPSASVLRPICANPMANKNTNASGSIESCIPTEGMQNMKMASPLYNATGGAHPKGEMYQIASAKMSNEDYASNALARMRNHGRTSVPNGMLMDVDDGDDDNAEPSSSSQDAKLQRSGSRTRTTPDVKRAQNRESAKRFRVAQKKRWAELQDTVERKDEEIARLKDMLQEITNKNLSSVQPSSSGLPTSLSGAQADALTLAELGLFVKLLSSRKNASSGGSSKAQEQPPVPCPASSIGSLHRVVVARLDGYVLGVRHQNDACGVAMGGAVGGCIWDDVHGSDMAHLQCTVVNAERMASIMGGQLNVFAYQRRRAPQSDTKQDGEQPVSYMRMKGCVYPLVDANGSVSSVMLAEFIETS